MVPNALSRLYTKGKVDNVQCELLEEAILN